MIGIGLRRPLALIALCAAALGSASLVVGREPELAGGKMLVAKRDMKDPNFARTVVLLVRHEAGGATGLIVNRQSEVAIAELLPDVEPLRGRTDRAYIGGPVNRSGMYLLFRSDTGLEGANRVVDGVYFSRNPDVLERLASDKKREFRVYAGYAGWGPGQLESELERGDWHVVEGSAEIVFSERPGGVWDRMIPREGTDVARLAMPPNSR